MKRIISMILTMLLILSSISLISAQDSYSIQFSLTKSTYLLSEDIKGTGQILENGIGVKNAVIRMVVKDQSGKSIYDLEQYTADEEGKFEIIFKNPYEITKGRYVIKLMYLDQVKEVFYNLIEKSSSNNNDNNNDDEKVEKETSQGKATVTKDENGNITVSLQINNQKVENQIENENSNKVTINAIVEENANEIAVNMNSDLVKKIKEKGKKIEIDTGDTVLQIDPSSIELEEGANVKLNINKLSDEKVKEIIAENEADDINSVSYVFDFDLTSRTLGYEKKLKFNKPITITMKYDPQKVSNPKKIGIYYYNEGSEKWEYIGGKVKANGTIEFTVDHFSKYTAMEYNKSFADVDIKWAKEQIEVLASRQIVKGMDGVNFDPYGDITRAQFAKMLVYALDLKQVEEKLIFTDVEEGKWFKEPIEIASSLGIVKGYGDEFRPNDKITREAMATMLIRALKYKDKDGDYTLSSTTFVDKNDISSWAKVEVGIAFNKGLVNGVGQNKFSPKENATRAEAAVIIYRLLELLEII